MFSRSMFGLRDNQEQDNNIHMNNDVDDDSSVSSRSQHSDTDSLALTITSSTDVLEVIKSLHETVRTLSRKVSTLEGDHRILDDGQRVLEREVKVLKKIQMSKIKKNKNMITVKSINSVSSSNSNSNDNSDNMKSNSMKSNKISASNDGGGTASSMFDKSKKRIEKGEEDEKNEKSKKNERTVLVERANSFGGIFFEYGEDSDDEDDIKVHGLGHDTYSLLKVKPVLSISWIFATVVILIQMTLLTMILFQQIFDGLDNTDNVLLIDIPFRVPIYARCGQFFAIIFTVTMSRDIFMPVKELSSLWFNYEGEWLKVTGPLGERRTFVTWLIRILMPNLLQIFVGSLALVISFVIIIQSDDVINLFSEFAAMSVIAELDNIAFWFAENGYAGSVIMNDVESVQTVKIRDRIAKFAGFNFRMILFIFLLICVNVPMIPVIRGQRNGDFFRAKYPDCSISDMTLIRGNFGDGTCHGGIINSYDCAFDGGDCIYFNIAYPNCNRALEPLKVGNGECDDEYNTEQCLYDGGDCCEKNGDSYLGDGICHAGFFHTDRCLFDGGDCEFLKKDFPNCPDYLVDLTTVDGQPIEIGNGVCDHGKENIREYMNEECGWVFGDCVQVRQRAIEMEAKYPDCYGVTDYWKIGDGYCDGGPYLKEECGFDEFDCCPLDHSKIGDGTCDSFSSPLATLAQPFNVSSNTLMPSLVPSMSPSSQPSAQNYLTKECAFEGYDCCEYTYLLKNGQCRGAFDNDKGKTLPPEKVVDNPQCGFDAIDCTVERYPDCTVTVLDRLGDGICNGGEYNVEECGFDDGDCILFNERYPLCVVNPNLISFLGNGVCDQVKLNNEECGWDGGDCVSFNAKYPDCAATEPFRVGDGYCNPTYNNTECEFDGGDCECENEGEGVCESQGLEDYPHCRAESPSELGDGECTGEYNTEECGWDGMDCFLINLELSRKYPNCTGLDNPDYIGDGKCDAYKYNTEECGWDGGDCIEFNERYPNCRVSYPADIGDGICSPDDNIEQCGWDGGDCIVPAYPNCHAQRPRWLGDGECDGPLYNTEECGWDGGDCINPAYPNCHDPELDPQWLGDTVCDPLANTIECGWDGGDCLVPGAPDCRTDFPSKIGDGTCEIEYNTTECNFDGGDCLVPYPLCNVGDRSKLGNGQCDSSSIYSENLNTKECGWDDGDCIIAGYPDCHVALPLELFGNGNCTVEYNTIQCGWDGGDCIVDGFPNCRTDDPTLIGDGNCTLVYNTTDCGFDGGDCLIPYPLCAATDRNQLGNGFCNTGWYSYYGYTDDMYIDDTENLNTEECGWDGGDCIIPGYPDCHVAYAKEAFGNGFACDEPFNNPECGFDGGDCLAR